MNLFNITLYFNGFPIKKAKDELALLKKLNSNQLTDRLKQKKWEIVRYHLKHNSFYKNLLKTLDLENWDDLPVTTKSDLQQPLHKRLSNGYSENNIYVNKTSGSSGHPFVFGKDKYAHAITWAIFNEWYNWYNVYGSKQARFYGIPKHGSKYFVERIKDFLANRFRFNVFDLSDIAIEKWVRVFSKKRFVYITGYTTVIVAFAKYLLSKRIVLKDICPTLKVCFPTSEMCSDEDKAIMEQAFGIPIKREYGAAEFGLIALENDSQWIINNLNLYIEIVDDNNKTVPYGQEGRILVTDLYNKAHPFIRYDIGDIGKINIVDNTPVLEHLIGRKEDYIKLPSGKIVPGLAFYYVTKSIMQDDGLIKEIKVAQTALNSFEIQYTANNEIDASQKQEIKKALIEYLEPGVKVSFQHLLKLERTKRGKLKQFTSLLNF